MNHPTLLQTLEIIEYSRNISDGSIFTRDELRDHISKNFPEHLDNVNLALKKGYLSKGVICGFHTSNKGFNYIRAKEEIPTIIRGANKRAIIDENGHILRWAE